MVSSICVQHSSKWTVEHSPQETGNYLVNIFIKPKFVSVHKILPVAPILKTDEP
jgi:hypothetical protein